MQGAGPAQLLFVPGTELVACPGPRRTPRARRSCELAARGRSGQRSGASGEVGGRCGVGAQGRAGSPDLLGQGMCPRWQELG